MHSNEYKGGGGGGLIMTKIGITFKERPMSDLP